MSAAMRFDVRGGVTPVFWGRNLDRPAPDLSDCLARREDGRPWSLFLLEPLLTKAPSPARCQPYCCYVRTVIFYHRPYISARGYPSRWRNGQVHQSDAVFVTYDQVETRLSWDDVVQFDGDNFRIEGGNVRWHHQRWWMHRHARRVADVRPIGGGR
jgi:hypothetical protein